MAARYCKCGPFKVNMIPQGMLKPYILFLLSKRPMHGFEIMEEISNRSHGLWKPGPAAVYPSLAWLSKNSYIRPVSLGSKGEKARRQYKITSGGSEAIVGYKEFEEEWFGGMRRLKDLFD
ncbi:MAG: PadR family transcriptional regulator [Candidatus Marsarchaeota archaeon]|jgi:DNA-binding PadR family transcriptional regulator|nr:PadR family transcriptional regulator [Candidatus Marsarchaeota archaeon]